MVWDQKGSRGGQGQACKGSKGIRGQAPPPRPLTLPPLIPHH